MSRSRCASVEDKACESFSFLIERLCKPFHLSAKLHRQGRWRRNALKGLEEIVSNLPPWVVRAEGCNEVVDRDRLVDEGERSEARVGVEGILCDPRRKEEGSVDGREIEDRRSERRTLSCMIASTRWTLSSRENEETDALDSCHCVAKASSRRSPAVASVGSRTAKRKILRASSIRTPPNENLTRNFWRRFDCFLLDKNSPSLVRSSSIVLKSMEAMLSSGRPLSSIRSRTALAGSVANVWTKLMTSGCCDLTMSGVPSSSRRPLNLRTEQGGGLVEFSREGGTRRRTSV